MKIKKFLFFLFSILFLGSCSSPYFLEFNEFTGGWENSESAEFSFISDQNPKNIFLILRHSNSYEYANIFLITELKADNILIKKDTLEYLLSKANGQWLGNKKLSLIEHKLPFLDKISLKENVDYSLKVRTSMRLNGRIEPIVNLEGILGLGLLIEERNN